MTLLSPKTLILMIFLITARYVAAYDSPYYFIPQVTNPALTPDFHDFPRDVQYTQQWSVDNYADWYNFHYVTNVLGSTWGPQYREFQVPSTIITNDLSWFQYRLAAAGNEIINTVPYAHHHMHVWNVPNEAPWTNNGFTPGQGIDCSDYTHWMYSYGLGMHLETGIQTQAVTSIAPMYFNGGGSNLFEAQVLFDVHNGYTKDFNHLVTNLQPGDLLYIRGDPDLTNEISHVIMWLGGMAYDTNGIDHYLVTDSHGAVVTNSSGVEIPSGPQIRPFRADEYYYSSFDHVLRFLPLQAVPEPSTYLFLALSSGCFIFYHSLIKRKGNGSSPR